jgi:putative addiction module killer protein
MNSIAAFLASRIKKPLRRSPHGLSDLEWTIRGVEPVGEGISEMKIDYGPGYRVYYKRTGKTITLILCGGDKSTQDKDIKRAKEIAAQL